MMMKAACTLLLGASSAFRAARSTSSPAASRCWSAASSSSSSLPGALDCDVAAIATSKEEWAKVIDSLAALPAGFQTGTTSLEFVPKEMGVNSAPKQMNLAGIVLDEATDGVAAVFTRNALSGCPVNVGRRRMRAKTPVRGIIVNNKISNVRPAGDGEADAEVVCAAFAVACGFDDGTTVMPASTGVIGWGLPVANMEAQMPSLASALQSESLASVASAIMTTDRYPKVARADLANGASVVGMAKGAGMIEPAMCATMLCFITTDAKLDHRDDLQAALERVVKRSFGSIGIDGDESTSDMVILLSSGQKETALEDFEEGLGDVCAQLAHHVVRNGEGTNHVIRLTVRGDESVDAARKLGRDIVNGPLFKAAIAGNDPNVGRLVGKLGQCLGARGKGLPLETTVSLCGETIYEVGRFTLDSVKEKKLSSAMQDAQLSASDIGLPGAGTGEPYPKHGRCVEVFIDLAGDPENSATVLGSDLTHQYVTENADYRS